MTNCTTMPRRSKRDRHCRTACGPAEHQRGSNSALTGSSKKARALGARSGRHAASRGPALCGTAVPCPGVRLGRLQSCEGQGGFARTGGSGHDGAAAWPRASFGGASRRRAWPSAATVSRCVRTPPEARSGADGAREGRGCSRSRFPRYARREFVRASHGERSVRPASRPSPRPVRWPGVRRRDEQQCRAFTPVPRAAVGSVVECSSRPLVGSSGTSSGERVTRAVARAVRCCRPPREAVRVSTGSIRRTTGMSTQHGAKARSM